MTVYENPDKLLLRLLAVKEAALKGKKYSVEDIALVKADHSDIGLVDLTKDGFEKNLVLAARSALEFARTLVVNELPNMIRYVLLLNVSYNDNQLDEDEFVFNEESLSQEFTESHDVAELLWRDGKVPEWINVSVVSETEEFTNIKLECCGRFTSNPKYIYHAKEGMAPFHVLGPPIPTDVNMIKDGEKYKL